METVPQYWSLRRIKEVGSIRYGLSQPPQYLEQGLPLIRATNIMRGKIVEKGLVYVSPNDVPYDRNPVLKKNDIVVVRSGAYTADSAIIPESYCGAIAGFDMVLRPCKIIPRYLSYVLLSNYVLKDQLILKSFRAAQPHLNKEELGATLILYPPLFEQKAIAEYLDIKTENIDRKIDLLTQKATRYSELKQSLINETVICGLDKTVAMKDSGVEWIGEVPEHWNMMRLKDLSNIQNSNVDKNSHEDEIPIRLCNYVDVYKNNYINSTIEFMQASADQSEIKRFTVRENDVFITKDSETCDDIAKPALATETLEGVLCGYHLTQIRTKQKVLLSSYLFRLLQSKSYGFRFVIFAKGITRVGLGQSAIADALTPVPPIPEQKAIADYLDEKTEHIDQIVEKIHSQIDKLKELRKTLINDVVTGKIKVVMEGETV